VGGEFRRPDRGGFRRERPSGPSGPPVDYRALVEFVARSIAEKPDEVKVESFERSRGTISVTVKLAEEDVGKLIGKGGRNIDALRALVRAASLRERRRVFVDLA
jgi:uncharacterized protein